jgi:CRISPR-associated protein Csm4
MEFRIVKLKFIAPLLLSKGSADYTFIDETLHSDTIKNALFACALHLFGNHQINESFFSRFTLSSAFPFYDQDFFLPKPFIRLNLTINNTSDSYKTAKKKKKLMWLERSIFESECNGRIVNVEDENFSASGKLLSRRSLRGRNVYRFEEQQRVKVNYTADSEPFFTMQMHFEPNAGLYVLVRTDDEFFNTILKPAFRLLGDSGVGSYRNVGNGHFLPEFPEEKLTLHLPQNGNAMVCLSLYCPLREELSESMLRAASYQLIKRGGYLSSVEDEQYMSWRKKSIYMFQEGSVFPAGNNLIGKLADVTPDGLPHKVYRDGQALFIPINITSHV